MKYLSLFDLICIFYLYILYIAKASCMSMVDFNLRKHGSCITEICSVLTLVSLSGISLRAKFKNSATISLTSTMYIS